MRGFGEDILVTLVLKGLLDPFCKSKVTWNRAFRRLEFSDNVSLIEICGQRGLYGCRAWRPTYEDGYLKGSSLSIFCFTKFPSKMLVPERFFPVVLS